MLGHRPAFMMVAVVLGSWDPLLRRGTQIHNSQAPCPALTYLPFHFQAEAIGNFCDFVDIREHLIFCKRKKGESSAHHLSPKLGPRRYPPAALGRKFETHPPSPLLFPHQQPPPPPGSYNMGQGSSPLGLPHGGSHAPTAWQAQDPPLLPFYFCSLRASKKACKEEAEKACWLQRGSFKARRHPKAGLPPKLLQPRERALNKIGRALRGLLVQPPWICHTVGVTLPPLGRPKTHLYHHQRCYFCSLRAFKKACKEEAEKACWLQRGSFKASRPSPTPTAQKHRINRVGRVLRGGETSHTIQPFVAL
ncbi:Death-inducer obliterator 1, partial [Ophiophagus hannah]